MGMSNKKQNAAAGGVAVKNFDCNILKMGATLVDLYDPLTMPPDLHAAHAANDRAVLAAYGLKPDTPEPEIVAHLFKLYAEKTKGSVAK